MNTSTFKKYLLLLSTILFETANCQNKVIDSLLNVVQVKKDDTVRIHTYNRLSLQYRRVSDIQNSIKYANIAMQLSESINYAAGKSNAFNNLGLSNFALSNYADALKYELQYLLLSKELNIKTAIASAYNNIGNICASQQNYSEALKNLYACLEELPMEEDYEGSVITLSNIIGNYTFLKDYDKAKQIIDTALKISTHVKDRYVLGILNGNIGNYYGEQFLSQKALIYHRKALEDFKSIPEKQMVGSALSNIGENLTRLADVDKNRRNKLYLYKSAFDTLNKGLEIAISVGAKRLIKDLYESQATLYKSLNNYSEAFRYEKLSSEMKDSVLNDETSRKLQQLKLKYEVEQAVKEEKINNEKLSLEEKAKHEKELSDEKLKEQQIANEEKVRHEKAEYDEILKHQQALAEEKLQQQQLILHQKLVDTKTLADERTKLQRIENEEKLQHEKALYEEQIKHQKTVVDQKRKQDLALSEKEKRNNRMLEGSAVLFISGLFTVLYSRHRMQNRRAIEKADALHRMAELELQSLRAQLNPHFMFNSLNAIQELIMKDDTTNSHIYLSRFSKLLRMLLENASQPFIQLQKEIDFLHLYLSLEKLRIPDLEYTFNIDPELEPSRLMTPNMMLQPYIENAIWHGLSHKKKDRKLLVNMKKTAKGILFEIIDNGVGREKAGEMRSIYRKEHQSKGMELLSRRFDLLSKQYGTKIETTIIDLVENNEPAGTEVDISVPVSLIEIKSTNDTISVN
jgi:tetratricopeptide (TPR) repeat protein